MPQPNRPISTHTATSGLDRAPVVDVVCVHPGPSWMAVEDRAPGPLSSPTRTGERVRSLTAVEPGFGTERRILPGSPVCIAATGLIGSSIASSPELRP